MKERYLVFQRRNGIFFLEDRLLKKQDSLRTRDKEAARRIGHAKNEALRQPAINLKIAQAYLMAGDPNYVNRTWQQVMDTVAQTKKGNTRRRWERAMREAPFDLVRDLKLIETQAEHFLNVLSNGGISTNVFLRRLHNFVLDMDWLPKPIIPRRQWAERAKEAGYPERFAQENLGHGSKAVTRAYAKKAKVKLPSLEDYERQATNKLMQT
jgi:hypothetical protein